jgi:hypothetical protein
MALVVKCWKQLAHLIHQLMHAQEIKQAKSVIGRMVDHVLK